MFTVHFLLGREGIVTTVDVVEFTRTELSSDCDVIYYWWWLLLPLLHEEMAYYQ